LDEAGLRDAVAFIIGGQQEGAIPQGFETRWRRTVHEREIKYQSIGPYAGFGQANDPQPPPAGYIGVEMRAQSRGDRAQQLAVLRDALTFRSNGLSCCLVSVRWRSVLVVPISDSPHPGRPCRRCGSHKNAPDDSPVSSDYVVIVIAF
jgi:hypothetical protein